MARTWRVTFSSGALRLEGELYLPDQPGRYPAAVVCHPHPLYGGSMHNNVVAAVCAALPSLRWAALRFNFRGVGGSAGSYGEGLRERDDVGAALSYLAAQPEVDRDRLAVIGYSFGAWVGLSAAVDDARVTALVAISPPVPAFDFGFLASSAKPKLLLHGDRDEFVHGAAVEQLVAALPEPKEHRVFPGVDHFWLGRDRAMAEVVAAFLTGTSQG